MVKKVEAAGPAKGLKNLEVDYTLALALKSVQIGRSFAIRDFYPVGIASRRRGSV